MKPTSVIFLILALILTVGGIVTCLTARSMAEADGVALFDANAVDGSDSIDRYDYDAASVSRIQIDVGDVDINIYGKSKEPYVELVNFPKNMYAFSLTGNNITISDALNLSSLFGIVRNGFEFSGLRHYLYWNQMKDRHRAINIYLSDAVQIKQFDITNSSGNVLLSRIPGKADYDIATGTGNVTVNRVNSFSTFKLSLGNGDLSFYSYTGTGNFDFKLNTGNIDISILDMSSRSYYLDAPAGSVTFGGEQHNSSLVLEPMDAASSLTAYTASGSIHITKLSYNEMMMDAEK